MYLSWHVRYSRTIRHEAPVRVALVGHRLIDQREEVGIVFFERLASGDAISGVVGRGVLTRGVEVGKNTFRPVGGAVVEGLAVGGHAHYLAKDMQAVATLPDGSQQWLLWIKDWDFSWQDQYQYKRPLPLPKGTRIDCVAHFDNSPNNQFNPDPAKEVRWGEQTWEEMMIGFFTYTVPYAPTTAAAQTRPLSLR